jgi:hypothetical protein
MLLPIDLMDDLAKVSNCQAQDVTCCRDGVGSLNDVSMAVEIAQ